MGSEGLEDRRWGGKAMGWREGGRRVGCGWKGGTGSNVCTLNFHVRCLVGFDCG